jgi:hypothetical protein
MCSVKKKLVSTGPEASTHSWPDVTDCVVPGLTSGTTYEVALGAKNTAGWGLCGPVSTVQLAADDDEVQFVGGRTREEKDAEARKHAIDVDALPSPAPKRAPKSAKTEQAAPKAKRCRPAAKGEAPPDEAALKKMKVHLAPAAAAATAACPRAQHL